MFESVVDLSFQDKFRELENPCSPTNRSASFAIVYIFPFYFFWFLVLVKKCHKTLFSDHSAIFTQLIYNFLFTHCLSLSMGIARFTHLSLTLIHLHYINELLNVHDFESYLGTSAFCRSRFAFLHMFVNLRSSNVS